LLYLAYQMQSDIMAPVRRWAGAAANSGSAPVLADNPALRNLTAVYELIARTGLTHMRPPFGIDSITINGREVEVREKAAARTPFATLLHFSKDIAAAQPRVLLVAPLSGHFSTLLRATVRTMLPEHDVFVTDWHNARDILLTAGRFGVDEYTDHLIKFLEVIGSPAHVLAVCQPCVAVLAAVAVMAQAANPGLPRSMTLMAGPIDTRVNPTKVNELAKKRSIDWFEQALTASVPLRYPGAFRRVYPGFVQLVAFMSMNLERHVKAHQELYENLANREFEKAAVTKAFYDEYFLCSISRRNSTSRRCSSSFRTMRCRLVGWSGAASVSTRMRFARPCSSPWRASATIFALSARQWRRTNSAASCGLI
jgi:poly(3-hydroxybutyrate) depolymerase